MMTESKTDNRSRAVGPESRRGDEGERIDLSGEDARQGEIILKSAASRRLFFGGLIACVLALLVIGLLS